MRLRLSGLLLVAASPDVALAAYDAGPTAVARRPSAQRLGAHRRRQGERTLATPPRLQMISAVVLAAGAATRFGGPKQALLLPEVLAALAQSSVADVVVVVGAYPLEADARVVECPDWERGPGASLRCGLDALPADAEAAVVVLADGPDLAPAAVDRVIQRWRDGAGDVVAASYRGVRGHPVVLGRVTWPLVPDEGARALEPVLVPCDDLGAPGDVDLADEVPGRLREDSSE
jgi:CTP:molybdopterin cytidylyltransferase MocA